jgi:hypothetical protein
MANVPSWPSSEQRGLEKTAHALYRDAILLIEPNLPLADDVLQRLDALDLSPSRLPVTREFLEASRPRDVTFSSLSKVPFFIENMKVCFDIATLIFKLENMRDFEQDMIPRLESRLRSVRMVQKWDYDDGGWIWVLEMHEDVQEGLTCGMRTATYREKKKAASQYNQADAGDAMEVDGQDDGAAGSQSHCWSFNISSFTVLTFRLAALLHHS